MVDGVSRIVALLSVSAAPLAFLLTSKTQLSPSRQPPLQRLSVRSDTKIPLQPQRSLACERLSLAPFEERVATGSAHEPAVLVDAGSPMLSQHEWASPTRSPFVTAGAGQRVVAYFAPDHLSRGAGLDDGFGVALGSGLPPM